MSITETVLEMHYHRPLMELFREIFGLGHTGAINFYKYSPQKECFIGFDQAFVKSEMGIDEFYDYLHASASSGYKLHGFIFGYFLQFKVVKPIYKRWRYTPSIITNRPHYRVSLDTTKNSNAGLSQHELLFALNKNAGAMVYYACPMLFDREDLYDINVNLDELRLVDLDSCQDDYTDNDTHFIYFDDTDGDPVWCSDPVVGLAITPRNFIDKIFRLYEQRDVVEESGRLIRSIETLKTMQKANIGKEEQPKPFELVHQMLTIVKISYQDG